MKITMLSIRDCAASGLRLCEAINEHTDHEIKLYQFRKSSFDHPTGQFVSKWNYDRVQREIDDSDVVHIKGDRPWKFWYPEMKHCKNLKIDHKPIVLTLSGTLTREVRFGGYGQCNRETYKQAKIITAHEPDLKHDWVDVLTYYPIRRVEPTWKQGNILQHIPSNRETKNTKFVEGIVGKLKKNVTFDLSENMPFHEVLEKKKKATLYFDQFVIGWYGNSGVEAMNYGVPVVSWISDFSSKQVDSPVITSGGGAGEFAEMIDKILDSDMSDLSRRTKEYCDKYHSYGSVAKQWNEIYESVR